MKPTNNKDNITISVILPVYNTGPWIHDCIASLKKQKQEGLEFIFVDDLGTDDTISIIEQWAGQDPRVRIIHNSTNLGSGRSRNAGIQAARGQYLSFIDPDDWISDNFYEDLYKQTKGWIKPDIVKGAAYKSFETSTNQRLVKTGFQNERIRKGLKQRKPLFLLFTYEHWSAIFHRRLFSYPNVCYGSSRTAQDTTFLLRITSLTRRIKITEDAKYYYRIRQGSATTANILRRSYGELDAFEEKIDTLLSKRLTKYSYLYLKQHIMTLHSRFQEGLGNGSITHEECIPYIERMRTCIQRIPHYEKIYQNSIVVRNMMENFDLYTDSNQQPIKISVILPVYNPGKEFNACIQSLKRQMLGNIEFIFIDDCSQDESIQTIKDWMKVDTRVKLIQNPTNIGPGPSRNIGIEKAKGQYLSFIDPDDYICDDFLELLYSVATQDKQEHKIAKGSCITVSLSKELDENTLQNKRILESLDTPIPLWRTFYYHHFTAIYHRSLFEDPSIRYGTTRASEDVVFSLKVGSITKDIVINNFAKYYYVQRETSLTHQSDDNRIDHLLQGLIAKKEALDSYGDSSYVRDFFDNHLIYIYNALSMCLQNKDLNKKETLELLQRIKDTLQVLPHYHRHMERLPEFSVLFDEHLLFEKIDYKKKKRKDDWNQFFQSHPELKEKYQSTIQNI